MSIEEVESPIDLRSTHDALTWANEVNIKRPWRYEFFELYVQQINQLSLQNPRILEIGSGLGHLAKVLLENIPAANYSAIDFSQAMHELSKIHLGSLHLSANYLIADFKQADWHRVTHGETYDVVIIHQALHELRHKAYAHDFHQHVIQHLLRDNGIYIVTDHIVAENGMKNNDLYMTIDEHLSVFSSIGSQKPIILKEKNALCSFLIKT